jgi:hypothetical protein
LLVRAQPGVPPDQQLSDLPGRNSGSRYRVERYDPVGIAAVSARLFRDALQRLGRFKQLTCPEEVHLAERGDECRNDSGRSVRGVTRLPL